MSTSSYLTQSKKNQLTVVDVASVGFRIQDQVQKFKCRKQSIGVIQMYTIIPVSLPPVLERNGNALKYGSIPFLLARPEANVLYFIYSPEVTDFRFLIASQKCS